MGELGKLLIVAGVVIVGAGLALMIAGRFGVRLGRLPGDFTWRGRHSVIYFPLATCIIVSVVLSLVLYLLGRIGR